MIYVDQDYYQNQYLLGRVAIIPLSEFPFWEDRARRYLGNAELTEVPDYLKKCVCQLAEEYFIDSEKQALSMMPTQSVGGYSKSHVIKYDARELAKKLQEIKQMYLFGTELHNTFIYRGV